MKKTLVARARELFRRVFFWLPSSMGPMDEFQPEAIHDHELLLAVTAPKKIPTWRQLRYGLRVVLSPQERQLVSTCLLAFVISTGIALGTFINDRTIRVPAVGGTLTEAVIGEPKYVSPIDASASDIDSDIASLVYSGLFRMNGLDPVPDLADSYNWSPDGKTLTVTLRQDARFQNGDPVTAQDVAFTIDAIQDPVRASHLSARFQGVKVVATDADTVQFSLSQPDVTFLQALTIGILPSRLWQDIPAADARLADLNIKPIGSGPYRFKNFTRDNRGSIRSYTLERWDGYYGVRPFIQTLTFQFFPDREQAEAALKGDLIDAFAFADANDTQSASSRWHRLTLDLPQETVAFFNLKNKTLSDIRVRTALASVVDRQEIVDTLHGLAQPITDPYPFLTTSSTILTLDEGRALLDTAGWKLSQGGSVRIFNPTMASTPTGKHEEAGISTTSTIATPSSTELTLTILTPDQPELLAVADVLKRRWSLLGARVDVQAMSSEDIVRHATRTRDDQIVLTNVLLDPSQDIFPFWWSGQAVDRGLNISNLMDRDVDTALAAVRNSTDTTALANARQAAAMLIRHSVPALFLVRPQSLYLITNKIQGVSQDVTVGRPADRFSDLIHWYINTGWRWK